MAARASSPSSPDRIHLIGHYCADGICPNPHNLLAYTNLDLLSLELVCHADHDYGPDVEPLRWPRLPCASLNYPHSGLPQPRSLSSSACQLGEKRDEQSLCMGEEREEVGLSVGGEIRRVGNVLVKPNN